MTSSSSDILFELHGLKVDLPLLLAVVGILLIAILQLSWSSIEAYVKRPQSSKDIPAPPIIETISEDKAKEKPRQRFRKDVSEIANWAQDAPLNASGRDLQQTSMEDPNTILPAGLDTSRVGEDGQVLDSDGSVLESGTIAYIRQQMIDRVMNTGAVDENEDESAGITTRIKLDIIKSIRDLSDAEVIEWYMANKEMLKY